MTTAEDARQASPWLSVWLRPRVTIERILAKYSTRQVLLLPALNAVLGIAALAVEARLTAELLDWRVFISVAFGGAAFGIAILYLSSLFFRWSGRLLGGNATLVELRAVLAWGSAPTLMGLVLCFTVLAALALFARVGVPQPGSRMLAVALQGITGVLGLWSLVTSMLMLSRVQKFGFWRTVASYALGYTFLLFPLLIRIFFFEPFDTPSGSMAPTLVARDYFFASKYSYGYSRYSLPLSPGLFSGRIMGSQPARGAVVVFRQPRDPSVDFVKRLVGLPGDRIQMKDGVLQINGEPVTREPAGDYVESDINGRPWRRGKKWRETLPNGVSYETADLGNGFLANTEIVTVPVGHYFVIGDNRNNSMDSRSPAAQGGGFVPFENLVGRAELIYFSLDQPSETLQPAVRFDRIGMAVR